ncbi:uncharacterized protein LOC117169489 [Belonocnema kinseyi]|uniref:uncharacterized protein LOC117169489 n=1 Tax=Belonocnema kinseyi TaxID=2817044 RepID=UPI00143D35C1|nr:uncharacterized protein LOC117169489 [Belonocnema kinseyi]
MIEPGWKLIRILSPDNVENSEIKLSESRTYLCGRGQNKDIVCNSKLVSKDHCIFLRDANKIYVQDLKSAVEYHKCKSCSENYNKFLHYASKSYEDYETYSRTLISLLLLEVACGIKSEFTSIEKCPLFTECVIVTDSVTEVLITERNSFLLSFEIKIECTKGNILQFPIIGDLLSIEIIGENDNSYSLIFAYVSEISVGDKGDTTLFMEDEDVKLSATYTVVTKWLEFDIYKRHIKSLRVIVGVLVALNLVGALDKLKTSPLLPLILHPKSKSYSLSKTLRKFGLRSIDSCLENRESYPKRGTRDLLN